MKTYLEKVFGYEDKIVTIIGGAGMLARYLAMGLVEAGARVSLWGRTLRSGNN